MLRPRRYSLPKDSFKVADIVTMIRATAQQEDPVGKCTSMLEVTLLMLSSSFMMNVFGSGRRRACFAAAAGTNWRHYDHF